MMKELRNVPATGTRTQLSADASRANCARHLVPALTRMTPTNKPLGPCQVAEILGVRRAYVRGLISAPVFKTEMARAVTGTMLLGRRSSAHPRRERAIGVSKQYSIAAS
jgi:hypothetical protein